MNTNLLLDFSVDKANKKINVEREFAAPVEKVWAAWTQSEILDQWWAPKPWKARTKKMDFKVGGRWMYAMVGPDGSEHWAVADYKAITPLKNFSGLDAFTDKEGNINTGMPRTKWDVRFSEKNGSTFVNIELTYEDLADLENIIKMGFKEGFISAMGNLDELL
jgi:uncharacterized protein YndB with AHSA1/START domain